MRTPFYDVDHFRPQVSVGYLLRRVNKLSLARVSRSFDGNDITFTQWVVMALVASGTAGTCTALARDMDHDSGAMTRVIDQLEERGFVVRTRDGADRRVTKLTMTALGQETVVALAASVTGEWNTILADFEREEVVRLIATLTRLLTRLETLERDDAEVSA